MRVGTLIRRFRLLVFLLILINGLLAAGFALLIVGALWVGRFTADDLPCVVLNDGEVLVDVQRANLLTHLPLPVHTLPAPTRPQALSLILVNDDDNLKGDSLFLAGDDLTQPRLLQRNVVRVMWSPDSAYIGFIWWDENNGSYVTITNAQGEPIGSGSQALNFGTPTHANFEPGAQGFSADSAYFTVMAEDLTTARIYRTADFSLIKTYGSQTRNFDFAWSPTGHVAALRFNGIVSLITPETDALASSSRYYRAPLMVWFGQGGSAGQGVILIEPERISSHTRYTVSVLHTSGIVLDRLFVLWGFPFIDLAGLIAETLQAAQQTHESRRMNVESASDVVASVRSPVSNERVYALIRPTGIQLWWVDSQGNQRLPIIPPKAIYTGNLRWLRCSEAAHAQALYGGE